ncbi:hypothetical protein FS749_010741 [Ceratobasidium sp. UAMH 11750]|nr:hypothetical protein FS749_010741 [Ceratobasidium sp. UAMH 11750]
MVTFSSQVASAIIFFALAAGAMSAAPPGEGNMVSKLAQSPPSVEDVAATVDAPTSSDQDEINRQLFSLPSEHTSAIVYDDPPPLKSRSTVGPRRLDSPEQRGHHKHGRHGHKRQATNQQSTNMASPWTLNPTVLSTTMARRSVYMTKGYGNHRISIKPVTSYLSDPDPDHAHNLATRGLLDPVIPIIGLIPGLEGVVRLVPELLNGILGPALGGLIISPNKPPSQALAASDGDTLENESQYILAATKGNASTIWLVDTGHPAPPDTESTSTSNSTVASTKERMVTLQMAFVDAKTGEFEPYCATYERDPAKPVSLGVVPCKDKNPKDSQMFAYNPETSILRAIWESVDAESLGLGGMRRRQYVVGDGMNVTAEGAESMVVMVFQAVNGSETPESLVGAATQKAHSLQEDPTPSLDNSTLLGPDGEAHKSGSSSNSQGAAVDDDADEDDPEDDCSEDASEDDSDAYDASAPKVKSSKSSTSAGLVGALGDATSQTTLPSETAVLDDPSATPVFVEHAGRAPA